MSTIGPNFQATHTASGLAENNISAYRALKLGSNPGQVTPCTAITDICIGISLETVSAGQAVTYQTGGVALVTCSSGVAYGAQVMATASGSGKCSTASGASARSIGLAVGNSTSNDGEVMAVHLNVPNVSTPANS